MNFISDKEEELLQLANRYIAGGVVSMNRKVSPGRIFCRGEGSKIWDIQGREYIDYHAAFSPFLLGHNNKIVNDAVITSMQAHWSLMGSGPTPWEISLAKILCESVPSVEQIQLTNSGSEATSIAIRLCQAYTGRDDIIVILGGYNGWQNEVARTVMPELSQVGERKSPTEYPFIHASAGISKSVTNKVHVVNFNDLESIEHVLRKYEIACVITEPVLQNIGVVHPHPGYLQGLIDLCERYGSLCIFDEVKTGFRTSLGGYQGTHQLQPHLSVFGKAVANGFPMGVVGGSKKVMSLFYHPDPEKRVFMAGTFNANPINCAAAIATITLLRDDTVYDVIEDRCRDLYSGLESLFTVKGVPFVLVHNKSAFCVYFCESAPRDVFDILENHDFEFDKKYRAALLEKGIYHIPVSCKQGSICYAHSADDISHTIEQTRKVLSTI